MIRRIEQRIAFRHLDQLAKVHHRDAVRDVPHHRQIVRYEQVGDAEALLQILQQVHHLRADRHIQRGHRFVRHDQPRLGRQRAGDRDALTLAAGEFKRAAAQMHRIQPNQAQQFDHPFAALRPVGIQAIDVERLGDDVLDTLARAERGIRILEHDLDIAPAPAQRATAEAEQILAAERDAAGGRFGQAQQHASRGGLAAAGFAHQRQRLARV